MLFRSLAPCLLSLSPSPCPFLLLLPPAPPSCSFLLPLPPAPAPDSCIITDDTVHHRLQTCILFWTTRTTQGLKLEIAYKVSISFSFCSMCDQIFASVDQECGHIQYSAVVNKIQSNSKCPFDGFCIFRTVKPGRITC